MKLRRLCLVLAALVLLDVVVAHKACTYDTIRLKKKTTSEEECRELCQNYTHHKKGRCFAYLYDAKNDECDGYVFDRHASYTDYEECGVNPEADVTLPESGSAQPSLASYSGCSFSFIRLGVVFNKEKCEELCLSFDTDNESSLYGDCVAWFWAPDDEECRGMLSSGSNYGRDICGFVG